MSSSYKQRSYVPYVDNSNSYRPLRIRNILQVHEASTKQITINESTVGIIHKALSGILTDFKPTNKTLTCMCKYIHDCFHNGADVMNVSVALATTLRLYWLFFSSNVQVCCDDPQLLYRVTP